MDEVFNEVKFNRSAKRLILLGGFLGAGKTTIINAITNVFRENGLSYGVITNDQAEKSVDTELVLANNADSPNNAEISGGCFCCKLNELETVLARQWGGSEADHLTLGRNGPDVIIAEPVGSCTDLVATVLLPLQRIFGSGIVVAPLAVMIDARRALESVVGRRIPGSFSKNVGYIYRKQIEESQIIVINKVDLVSKHDLDEILSKLEEQYPGRRVYPVSARTGLGISSLLNLLMTEEFNPESLIELDYERYGEGEAALGWFNASYHVISNDGLEGDQFLAELANSISAILAAAGAIVAHFKISLKGVNGEFGVVNQVLNGVPPEISRVFGAELTEADITINIRAEIAPDVITESVISAILGVSSPKLTLTKGEMSAFRPAKPTPVERYSSVI